MNLKEHCIFGFCIRIVLIFVGLVQDAFYEVAYTDVDYKVFSDAARHVLNLKSPYRRHTYRYSPILAYLLVPNSYTFDLFGKILFSFIDTLITDLIYRVLRLDKLPSKKCKYYSLFWLYNPLSIIISTRGNADSLSALIVLLTIWLYYRDRIFLSGIVHGLSIHFRMYPLIYSLPLYLAIEDNHSNKIFKLLYPNKKRICLVASCLLSLSFLTYLFYYLYGYQFLNDTYLFHFHRTDIRHNYSVYFYLQYLSYGGLTMISKIIIALPQIVLLLLLSIFFGNKKDLIFCLMTQTFVFVTFNRVLTCQYFIWYLSLLPLCLPHIDFKLMEMALVGNFWMISQIAWLLPAYLLEFKSKETFFYIWIQGLVFFWANIILLSSCIRNYRTKRKTE